MRKCSVCKGTGYIGENIKSSVKFKGQDLLKLHEALQALAALDSAFQPLLDMLYRQTREWSIKGR